MGRGTARRERLGSLPEFGNLIQNLKQNEAFALGALRDDLPQKVEITTKQKLNAHAGPGVIARTSEYIQYRPDRPAPALIDIDTKGMPDEVKKKIADLGGFLSALESVIPELADTARVVRNSTSSGLSRADTGAPIAGSNGQHAFVLVKDGEDTKRFLRTLHDRCWLAGLGWMMVSASGQCLERSLIDRMVYAPERWVFEAAPMLEAPLVQDQALRIPEIHDGGPIDTRTACRDLTPVEQSRLRDLLSSAKQRLAEPAARARHAYIAEHAPRLAERIGCSLNEAQRMLDRKCGGTLLPAIILPFDAAEFEGATVGDVLADPDKFVGATLSDPLEGPDYGRGKAKIMRRPDGSLWVKSYAHGHTRYDLKHDARSLGKIIAAGSADDASGFVRLMIAAKLGPAEDEQVRKAIIKKTGMKARTLQAEIKAVRAAYTEPSSQPAVAHSPYRVVNNRLVYVRAEDEQIPLANFAAYIELEQTIDDGLMTTRVFRLSGTQACGTPLPVTEITIAQTQRLWWLEQWGADAIVQPGLGQQHLITAIQSVSAPVKKKSIYAHTGWRKLDGRWLFLHAGGAIGPDGDVDDYEVRLGGELDHYVLPPVRDAVAAVRASLEMMDLGRHGIEMLSAVYRAPLAEFCNILCSVYLHGTTGLFKSQIEGVAQAHFGKWWSGSCFPANWTSTGGALEKTCFILKDVLCVIDDFMPSPNPIDRAKYLRAAEQLLRGAGNQGGRSRLTADITLRPTYWPRGMVMASGEDVPLGHSLRARAVISQVKPGEIDAAKLTNLQRHASSGLLAEAMAAYIGWLAGQADTLADTLATELAELRAQLTGVHARTPDNLASLLLGLHRFLTFAVSVGALTNEEAEQHRTQAMTDLSALAEVQDEQQASEDPIIRFPDLISQALMAGMVHIGPRSGEAPIENPESYGWQLCRKSGEDSMAWSPRGDRIGWMDEDDLWLLPAVAFKVVDNLERSQGRALGKSLHTLAGALADAGIIERASISRVAKSLRVAGENKTVWKVKKPDLFVMKIWQPPEGETQPPLPLSKSVVKEPDEAMVQARWGS